MTERLAPHGGCWWDDCEVCNTERNPYPTSWNGIIMDDRTPGQVAYEKWLELVQGPPKMNWDELPNSAKQGWQEIAFEVISYYDKFTKRQVT